MALTADTKGVLVRCPSCGSTNRLRFEALDHAARCGKCRTALAAPAAPIEISSDALFDALVSTSPLPVVVDFWAPWCGPCRAMAPELEKAAQHLSGRAVVVKVNTEALGELGERYRIRSIPTLALFRNGAEVNRSSGARPAGDIEAFVAQTAGSPNR
jgi:thioredoxin 2